MNGLICRSRVLASVLEDDLRAAWVILYVWRSRELWRGGDLDRVSGRTGRNSVTSYTLLFIITQHDLRTTTSVSLGCTSAPEGSGTDVDELWVETSSSENALGMVAEPRGGSETMCCECRVRAGDEERDSEDRHYLYQRQDTSLGGMLAAPSDSR